eukprot:13891895-Alexandrium_andersonii.AAC.1
MARSSRLAASRGAAEHDGAAGVQAPLQLAHHVAPAAVEVQQAHRSPHGRSRRAHAWPCEVARGGGLSALQWLWRGDARGYVVVL